MKRVIALDKENGTPVGLINAGSVTEATRRAFSYQCPHTGCDASFHWVKAYNTHGNTESRDATFAKDPGSAHRGGCPADLADEFNAHEPIDYISEVGGTTHVRINFPLGSAKVDKFPQRGYLSEQLLAAAQEQKIIQPFSSLSKLTRYLEERFGSLESEAASNVVVHYQGREIEWGKLFKGSDRYDKLYWRTQNHKYSDDGKDTPPIITVVRPVKELEPTEKGNRRFGCESQKVKIDGRQQTITPVIVCDHYNPRLAAQIEGSMMQEETMIVSARPFHPGMRSKPTQFGELRISMFIHRDAQIGIVDEKYWHPGLTAAQLDLFSKRGPSEPSRNLA